MTRREDVEKYLRDLRVKIGIFDIYIRDDRGKNAQALLDLDITPDKRKKIIMDLKVDDYSEGPLEEKQNCLLPMWVFGTQVNKEEVYIKVSMAAPNCKAICISFHLAEYPINYPFKKQTL
jgi:hypothetical protein